MAERELVFGIHATEQIVDAEPERILRALVTDRTNNNRLLELLEKINVCGCHIKRCNRVQLDKMSGGGRHQGIIIEIRGTSVLNDKWLDQFLEDFDRDSLFLVLDGVQDPHNLGACLRVADGAGVAAVIAPKNRAAGLTVSAKKVASGAAVPFVQVTNLARTLRKLKDRGVWLIGTSDQATDTVFDANLTGPLAIVMGGEEKGIRRLTGETCDSLVSIPMSGAVSSLNVSVASGVMLYEALRQRR